MNNQKRIALFVDIDNMPLTQEHINNIVEQLETSGQIVYAKFYGASDRRHRDIICDVAARGFEIAPPVNPKKRGSNKVFDVRILVDLTELVCTNMSITSVAIVGNPISQVHLFSKLKKEDIEIFACNNLDSDSAKFVDEVLDFGFVDMLKVPQPKKAKVVKPIVPAPVQNFVPAEPAKVVGKTEPVAEVVETEAFEEVQTEEVQAETETIAEVQAETEVFDDEPRVYADGQPIVDTIEEPIAEVVEDSPIEDELPAQADDVATESDVATDEEEIDILSQIEQLKTVTPSDDSEEDAELLEKIRKLLDEFN